MAVLSYKCPNCGGELIFDPNTQKYKCEYCFTDISQEKLDTLKPAQSSEKKTENYDTDSKAVFYQCPSCGAEIVTEETTAATFCYYCHNPVVLSGRVSGEFLPDKIIPFSIDKKKATEKFLEYVLFWIKKMYGKNLERRETYAKIINEKHFRRICGLIEGEEILIGGIGDEKTLQIAPTVLNNIKADAPVMQEEIFGPILPVLEFEKLDDAEQFIKARPNALALYLFTKDRRVEKRITENISYGGGCINDTIIHLATSHMGFGGVGNSGMGSYHGKESFGTFSHRKGILKKCNWLDNPVRYAPYTKKAEKVVRWFLR